MDPFVDDFALFGLPRRFALDEADVDARWRALQAQVHPDRRAHEGAASQALALQWSLRVNEARARLKNPLQRADLLCALRGAPVAGHGTALPQSLLLQQMRWREALASALAEADVQRLADEVLRHEGELLGQLRTLLDERGEAAAAVLAVQALRFVARLREDIDDRLAVVAADHRP